MSVKCEFPENCPNEVSHECFINNKVTLFCHSHLLKILASGTLAQSVKSVDIILSEKSKALVLNSLIKALSQTQYFLQSFKQISLKKIKEILNEDEKVEKEIEILNNKIIEAASLIRNTTSVKSFANTSELLKICLGKPEEVSLKLEKISYFDINIEDRNNSRIVNIANKIDSLLTNERRLVDPVCLKGHKLMFSQDSSYFYSFITNSNASARCDICKSTSELINYHCRDCGFDMCSNCATSKNFKPLPLPVCSNNHPTAFIPNVRNHFKVVFCDKCRNEIFTNTWRCSTCDFDCCELCALGFGVLPLFKNPFLCSLQHRMILANDSENFVCTVCKKDVVNMDSWKCDKCEIRNCKICIQSIGHRSPKCPKTHDMINKCGKKKSVFFGIGVSKCSNCFEKLSDFGFVCKGCNYNLCESCFLSCPQLFYQVS